MVDADKLVENLRRKEFRCRTGVLSIPTPTFGTEAQIAAMLGIEFLDYGDRLKAMIPPGSEYMNFTLTQLITDLDDIANAKTGETVVMIANFDLALARLRTEDNKALWQTLLTDFPHKTRALLFCVPAHQNESFSFPDSGILRIWRDSDRFAQWDKV